MRGVGVAEGVAEEEEAAGTDLTAVRMVTVRSARREIKEIAGRLLCNAMEHPLSSEWFPALVDLCSDCIKTAATGSVERECPQM